MSRRDRLKGKKLRGKRSFGREAAPQVPESGPLLRCDERAGLCASRGILGAHQPLFWCWEGFGCRWKPDPTLSWPCAEPHSQRPPLLVGSEGLDWLHRGCPLPSPSCWERADEPPGLRVGCWESRCTLVILQGKAGLADWPQG